MHSKYFDSSKISTIYFQNEIINEYHTQQVKETETLTYMWHKENE